MKRISAVFWTFLLLVPWAVQAQDAPSEQTPLECLEQERALLRRARVAMELGNLRRAASALAEAASLPHLIPLPFSSAPARPALTALARSTLKSAVLDENELGFAEDRQAVGSVCAGCQGIGHKVCPRCMGQGSILIVEGRRSKRQGCVPYEVCGDCDGALVRDATPEVQVTLQALGRDASRESERKDALAALRGIAKSMQGKDARGFKPPESSKDRLRSLLGGTPLDPNRISHDLANRLRDTWSASTPISRRTALLGYALESLAAQRHFAFLDSAPDAPPPLSQILKQAESVTLEELESGVAIRRGTYFSVVVTADVPGKAFLDAISLPLSGRISVVGGDPLLVSFCCYTPEDLELLTTLGRLGAVPGTEKVTRSYPPRAVPKALGELGTERPIRLTGRLLANPSGTPAHVFEVWHAAADEAGEQVR